MIFRRLFCFLGVFIYSISIFGQQFQTDPNLRPFQMQVKQLSELIDRFNYKIDPIGEPIGEHFKNTISRKEYILSLFNYSDPLWGNQTYQKLISAFADSVVSNNVEIFKYSERISAHAKTRIFRKGKQEIVNIILQQEIVNGKALKWSIKDINSLIYKMATPNGETFIPPTNHETNFTKLQKILNGDSLVLNYAARGFQYSPLSIFFFEIYEGILKIQNVEEITYFIHDIDGYEIQVKYFNRDSDNSGWLISKLLKL